MNSPHLYFYNIFSNEINNNIQSYLINETAYQILQEYFSYLIYKKNLYQDFCYTQYIEPNCKCYRYYNPRAKRWKTRDCYLCDEFEYSDKFLPNDFKECISNNNQFYKIMNYKY